jgi:hypothetical protein
MSRWIQTATGKAFDPFDADPAAICIEDIAHALSNVCRFTGHCRQFYSVAQHSVEVATRLPHELQAAALLHDASEAYLTDLPRPIKKLPQFKFYREAEERLQLAIYRRFGLTPSHEDQARIKLMDGRMLMLEKQRLLGKCEKDWDDQSLIHLQPAAQYPGWRPLLQADAKREFLNVFFLTFHDYAQESAR